MTLDDDHKDAFNVSFGDYCPRFSGSHTTAGATPLIARLKKSPLANGYGSVCIISIIRLVVLSRLAAVDVTCMYNHSGLTGLS